ncbi:RNA-recognition motif (RRM) Nup35-type domain [Macleaya cordata]|uniref:Nuclear pore complex protein NUP35 n=1 Tax=Macleaya cordata TaxID=56857 RepID=A0A200QDL3_MACCD|nr:RNA-recognition motif (RRM) Nup35-type domain [Macleaya cordata]
MNTTVQKTPKTGGKSLFFHDLASPIATHRGKFSTPGQAAAVSALKRENFGGTDPPPPPIFTLEDRVDFSPESGMSDYPLSSDIKSDMKTPVRDYGRDSLTPFKSKFETRSPYSVGVQQMQQSPASSSWWSPGRSDNEHGEKGKGSPVEGVVKPGALITLPPPREVARPELPRNSLPASNLDEEEWVTVYGFSPGDTNYVLREFEKCGVVLKHVPGPGNANWMHILYQNQSDAQKALSKNGMQINGLLIVGVKPLDPNQQQALTEGFNNQGFMTFPPAPSSSRNTELIPSRASSSPHYLQNSHGAQRSAGAIATPAKSMVSRIADLMFGI